jgi:hypothetical protein
MIAEHNTWELFPSYAGIVMLAVLLNSSTRESNLQAVEPNDIQTDPATIQGDFANVQDEVLCQLLLTLLRSYLSPYGLLSPPARRSNAAADTRSRT